MEPNGSASSSSSSPFANVRLAVDAYTLDTAAGKRRLKQIEQDGTLTFEEPKPPRAKRTEALERIWNEYPNGLLDLSETELRDADPTITYGEDKDEKEKDKEAEVATGSIELGKLMTAEEMEALRSEVFSNLNDARNELWFILELAKTLAASNGIESDPPPDPIQPIAPLLKKGKGKGVGVSALPSLSPSAPSPTTALEGEPPILPGGTYTTTPSSAPVRTPAQQAYELELALAAKQRALDDCGALIDAAVDELRLMASAGSQFARDIRRLRDGDNGRGQWAVVPKPDFAKSISSASRKNMEMAKDVVVPYALDEAPASLRQRSLAAFDLDPRHADHLSFSSRSYHRLRLMLNIDGERTGSKLHRYSGDDSGDILEIMQMVQLETVDEDLFNEIRAEANRIDGAAIDPTNVVLKVGKNELTIQLYDTREEASPTAPHSPICDALLASARLGLMHACQRRKQRLVDPAPSVSPLTATASAATSSGPPTPPNSILLPLINVIQYHAVCNNVRPTLSNFRDALRAAGHNAALVERHASSDSPDALMSLLSARAKVDVLGAVFTLELAGCPGVTVNVTAPAGIYVVTPCATFPQRDTSGIGPIVAREVSEQLAHLAYTTLRDATVGVDDTLFFYDELENNVVLGPRGVLRIELAPPYDVLRVYTECGSVPAYDSREAPQGLHEWLVDLARVLPTTADAEAAAPAM